MLDFPTDKDLLEVKEYPPRKSVLISNDDGLYNSCGCLSKMDSFPCGKSIMEMCHGICVLSSIFSDMSRRHFVHFLLIFVSYLLVMLTGAAQLQLVDTSFFRAVGLLLAVLLSSRCENAMTRRQELMEAVLQMINSAQNLLYLFHFDREARSKLREVLYFMFKEIAECALRIPPKKQPLKEVSAAGLNSLPDQYRDWAFVFRAKHDEDISTRPLLIRLRHLCDELFDPDLATETAGPEKVDKVSIIRRYHQNSEKELRTIVDKFDFLLMFRESFVTDQFRWMLETVIFVYIVLYPWCVCHESNMVLGATTFGMAVVFYGLNALTEQLEDPVNHPTQGFDLKATFVQAFCEIERDDNTRQFAHDWLGDHTKLGIKATQDLHDKFEKWWQPRKPPPPRINLADYADMV